MNLPSVFATYPSGSVDDVMETGLIRVCHHGFTGAQEYRLRGEGRLEGKRRITI